MTAIRDMQYDLLIQQSDEYMKDVHELSAQGYRPRTCFHGASLWTEYDNICGACEDGEYDPRYHSEDSEEFKTELEGRVENLVRNQTVDTVIKMIQENAENIRSETDLIKFFAKTYTLREIYTNA